MQRGEIWWARLDRARSSRPVLLLTRNEAYGVRTHVTVAPLTKSARPIRAHVPVGPLQGLKVKSVVNADDIITIPMSWLDRRLAMLDAGTMSEVERAIKFALDLK
ncbi:MAG TPA: type II toxin-antitoxin system PemK/MazF family toxin [Dehalococcoidia bacterium]|nr:type II toxin-antitoxin system PemK/MazF family toxin [Dehalococcoidia bacterium]